MPWGSHAALHGTACNVAPLPDPGHAGVGSFQERRCPRFVHGCQPTRTHRRTYATSTLFFCDSGRWPQLLAALAEPVFFQQAGTLIVWHRQDAAEALRLTRQLEANQHHVPELPALQKLDGAALAQAEPTLAQRFAQGLYLPGEGQLDNRQLLAALVVEMQRLSVRTHWHSP